MEQYKKKMKKITGSLASLVVGIDPGKGGGMCIIKSNIYDFGVRIHTAHNCPETVEEMAGFVNMLKSESPYITCFLERVHAFPTDGRSSAFKFGMNYGMWRGILCAFGIKTELITPQAWQKTFGKLPKNKQERKRKLRDIATEKSTIKATLRTADAICIALYGQKVLEENRKWV